MRAQGENLLSGQPSFQLSLQSQVCHSKNGEINTNKIQKMVAVYVKKYVFKERHVKKVTNSK